ncbi:putative aldouronate transport system permease protein [Anaerotaenia torta]|uniref:ABC transporter permease n=1 Tax=Anaerotaenia torta TaxID=433293 RepID=UPI003D20C52B
MNEVAIKRTRGKRVLRDILRDKWLYFLLLPGVVFFIIFRYVPMFGLRIAFLDYNPFDPPSSPFVGLHQFKRLFTSISFPKVFWNTLKISMLKSLVGFPVPIILALLLNEVRVLKFKKFTQTVLYLPHFISWVIMAGLIRSFVNPTNGLINVLITQMGGKTIDFLTNPSAFVPLLVLTEIYKSMGWGTIIYFAAISGVDEQLYESASIDGANRWHRVRHITLPAIRPVIIIVFILNLGNILNAGFEQIFLLYSPLVYDVADVIDTFVYRAGIIGSDYSFSTAAGLFKSVVALIMIVGANRIAKTAGQEGIY